MHLHVISFNLSRAIAALHSKQTGPKRSAVILSEEENPRISAPRQKRLSHSLAALSAFVGILLTFTLIGCHSAFINATVSNRTSSAISLVQVEYPSASFGIQTIAPGADFHYRFKILGSGPMKITYTDTAQHEQKSTGPTLTEGTEGALTVTVADDGIHWQAPPRTR